MQAEATHPIGGGNNTAEDHDRRERPRLGASKGGGFQSSTTPPRRSREIEDIEARLSELERAAAASKRMIKAK
jgi:hypothetical protein